MPPTTPAATPAPESPSPSASAAAAAAAVATARDDPDPVRGASPAGTRAHTGVVGEDALLAATGHPRAHWFSLLDAEGATGWTHKAIAAWLVETHGVDAWWSQGLTVGYEQARGLRVPGQRQDGSFESSSSKTVPVGVPDAYRLVADPHVRDQWLDMPVTVTGETTDSSVRWTLPDSSRAVVRVQAVRPGATRVTVQHRRLADADAVTDSKALWSQRLGRLVNVAAGR
jgi:hypothetical protein